MIRIEFSEDEIKRLRRERFGHPHPRAQQKMESLLIESEGLPHHQMTPVVGVSDPVWGNLAKCSPATSSLRTHRVLLLNVLWSIRRRKQSQ